MAKLRLAAFVVASHVLVQVAHGMAHLELPVEIPVVYSVFILIIVTLAPLVGFGLMLRGQRIGCKVLAMSMAASLAFGLYVHLVLPGPDNLLEVPDQGWGTTFRLSAAFLALTEAISWCVAVLALKDMPRPLPRRPGA